MSKKLIDLTGFKNGRLTVLSKGPSDKYNHTRWNCRCNCGKEMLAWGHRLREPGDLSCGCWHREKTSKRAGKHFMRNTPEYAAWRSMKNRCSNAKDRGYRNYGARGIQVCSEWFDSFEVFIADVGPRPTPGHSLGRIDNDSHYQPGNVRWENDVEQQNNTRNNRLVSYRGQTMTAMQAIRAAGGVVSRTTLDKRLSAGWAIERAVETSANSANNNFGNRRAAKLTERDVREIRSLRGTMTQKAISQRFGVSDGTISHILSGSSWASLKD